MKCPAAKELIEAYVDGELDATQKSEVRGHLEGCISCAEEHWRLLEMRNDLRKGDLYYKAPAHLLDRVAKSLRRETRTEVRPRAVPWNWMAVAASILLAVSVGWNVHFLQSRQASPDRIASEILSNHVRSLTENHLLDVPSSDQHTVKPWFNGRIDFSPAVKDFAGQGYPLVGGRIDYVDEKPAAVLVYRHAKHVINVFTWPETSGSGVREVRRRGFNLVEWTSAGMTSWAVSDLNLTDLREFVKLLGAGA